MKRLNKLILPVMIAMMASSCMKDFLQMPTSSATTVESVFSTRIKAQGAIANA